MNFTIRFSEGSSTNSPSRVSSTSSFSELADSSLESPEVSVEMKLTHCDICLEIFDTDVLPLSSRLRMTVKEIEILDHIASSNWTKFLSSAAPSADQRPRETDRDMVKMELSVRHDNEHALRVCLV